MLLLSRTPTDDVLLLSFIGCKSVDVSVSRVSRFSASFLFSA